MQDVHVLPKMIYLETTNHCNLACSMCPHGSGLVKNKGYMDKGLYEKVIDELDAVEGYRPEIALHITGEPLLHKEIVDFVHYASVKQFPVSFHTNGMLLDTKLGSMLIEAGLSAVTFSFEGEDGEFYEKLRKNADYHRTRENIKKFIQLVKACNRSVEVTVEVLKFRNRDASLELSDEFMRDLEGAHFKAYYASDWHGALDMAGTSEEGIKACKAVVCNSLKNDLFIAWNGDILPCGIDYAHECVLGNAKTDNVIKNWLESDSRINLTKALTNGSTRDIKLCKNCGAPYTVDTKERMVK